MLKCYIMIFAPVSYAFILSYCPEELEADADCLTVKVEPFYQWSFFILFIFFSDNNWTVVW